MAHQLLWHDSNRRKGVRWALHWWKNGYKSEVPPKGYVWIVHGLGEHGGRYAELAVFLTGLGFDVLAPDIGGHGLTRTEGGAKDLLSLPEAREELQDLVAWWFRSGPVAARGISHTPWFLLGHSLGALTALEWILRGRGSELEPEFARRAFISAPPLRLRLPIPAWKPAAAGMLRNFLPNLKMANGIRPEDLSYDAANVAAYRSDPLVHGHATPKNFLSMIATANEILAKPREIEVPVCLAVGADDPIVDPAAVRDFYAQLGTHKRFLEFPESKHEILNEIGRSRAFDAIAAWFL